ncbi:hypothetical protein K445DRAFT_10982 [Daldinia sp. EC12]|nr:hypothetical protein K445DRAFT_10982 [Daldinia sp. EC12]
MANTYIPGTDDGYGDQPYWLTSTAMARDVSHGSEHSNYSATSNVQYDFAVSAGSENMGSYDFYNVADAGSYATSGQAYDVNNQAEEQEFQYQFYDFIANDNSGQGPYWRLKSGFTSSAEYPEILPIPATNARF